MRCLVAEDYADTRAMLVLALERAGWEVFAAKDGREALRIYHDAIADDHYFDLVLLDIVMPRLGGIAVGMNVRNLEKYGEIPRATHVYLTGHDDVAPPDRLLKAEVAGDVLVDAYIKKPIAPDELVAEIERVMKQVASRPS